MVGKKGKKKSSESIRATPKRSSSNAKRYFNSGSSNSDSDDEEEFQPAKKSSRKSRQQENSVAKARKTTGMTKSLDIGNARESFVKRSINYYLLLVIQANLEKSSAVKSNNL